MFHLRNIFIHRKTNIVSREWVNNALQEINQLKQSKTESPKTQYSARHSDDVRYSDRDDIVQYSDRNYGRDLSAWLKTTKKKTFQEQLKDYIFASGMSNPMFYKASYMDRKLFSAINTNPQYQPTKETAVACCFGLKLALEDAEILINSAGYSLSMSIGWDRVVYYCLREKIYDLLIVNELLYESGEKCIRA